MSGQAPLSSPARPSARCGLCRHAVLVHQAEQAQSRSSPLIVAIPVRFRSVEVVSAWFIACLR